MIQHLIRDIINIFRKPKQTFREKAKLPKVMLSGIFVFITGFVIGMTCIPLMKLLMMKQIGSQMMGKHEHGIWILYYYPVVFSLGLSLLWLISSTIVYFIVKCLFNRKASIACYLSTTGFALVPLLIFSPIWSGLTYILWKIMWGPLWPPRTTISIISVRLLIWLDILVYIGCILWCFILFVLALQETIKKEETK